MGLPAQVGAPGGLPTGTVTFLFTDIEGSTSLLRTLGSERYEALLAAHRDLLAAAIADAQGVVLDAEGDAVFAAFESARRGLVATVAAQRALAGSDLPITVRMGLHTGEARPTDAHGYVGLPVHRAKRVSDSAHGGQVVISAATRELVSDELPADVRLRDLGPSRLAGFEGPERLWQVVIEGLPEEFPTVRAAGAGEQASRLLERDAELADLDAAIDAAARGFGSAVAIEAGDGIGRTRLLTEACDHAARSGLRVLSGRGAEMEQAMPFGVVRQLLAQVAGTADSDDGQSLLTGAAALAAPPLAGGRIDQEPDAAFAGLHGLYWLLVNLAERGPVALAVDDIHWADVPSRTWLEHLADRIEGVPVAVLVAGRPPAGRFGHVIRPRPLTPAATAVLAREHLGRDVVERIGEAISDATGGNPLLVRELAAVLSRERLPGDPADVAAHVRRLAPEVVGRRVQTALAKLGREAADLVTAVALLGDDVEIDLAATLADLDAEQADGAAALLARADILQPGRPLRFVHPLVGAAVYDGLRPLDRAREHGRAADLLADLGAPPDRVAAQLARAGRDSPAPPQPQDAPPGEAETLSSALRTPELHRSAFERLDGLRRRDAAGEGARAVLGLRAYAGAIRGERVDEVVAAAERALSHGLPDSQALGWSFWGAVSALVLADRFDVARVVCDEAATEASRRGAVHLFCRACAVRAGILRAQGALTEAEADARAAAEAMPDPGAAVTPVVLGELALTLVERGLLDEAASVLERAGPIDEAFPLADLLHARGAVRLARGDATGAASDARAHGAALKSVGFVNPAGAHWRTDLASALLAEGDRGEAGRLALDELDRARRWGVARPVGRALRVLGLAQEGQAGVDTLGESVAILTGSPAILERARSLVELGTALGRAGRRADARDRLRTGLDLARRCGAAPLAERAAASLAAEGARPRTPQLSRADTLTPAERRVARMAAAGMGDREIAQSLFVTQRTVELRLSDAFGKLDIGSRTQLADALV